MRIVIWAFSSLLPLFLSCSASGRTGDPPPANPAQDRTLGEPPPAATQEKTAIDSPRADSQQEWTVSGRLLRKDGSAATEIPVHFSWHRMRTTTPLALPAVSSGHDGGFRFSTVPPRDWFMLELGVDDPGSALVKLRLWLCWLPHSMTTLRLGNIYLEPPQTLRVRVVSPSGVAVAGAQVAAERYVYLARQRIEQEGLPESRQLSGAAPGEYVLERAGSGSYSINVRAKGFAFTPNSPARTEVPQDAPLTVRLKEAARIAGVVRDTSGTPISGAEMSAHGKKDWQYYGEIPPTGPDGRFDLPYLLPGVYELRVDAKGFSSVEFEDLATGSVDLEVTLAREAVMSGLVVSESGLPIHCATVVAMCRKGPRTGWGRNTRTDTQGRFKLHGLSRGTFEISVSHDRFFPPESFEVNLEEGNEVSGLVLRMRGGIEVSGTVTDAATGKRIVGVRVSLTRDRKDHSFRRSTDHRSAKTDVEGHFTLGGLEPGLYKLCWNTKGFLSPPCRFAEVVVGNTPNLELTLERGGTIIGTVRDAGGNVISGARVSARSFSIRRDNPFFDPDLDGTYHATTDAEGRFKFAGVPPASDYEIEVEHRSHSPTVVKGVRAGPAGETEEVEIILSDGGGIRGRVFDARGEPVEGAWFYVRAVLAGREKYFPRTSTDENGAYEASRLPPGDYTLEVSAKALRSAKREVHVDEGQVTDPVDFVLDDGESVSGRVVDVEGRPVAGVRVEAKDHGSLRAYTVATGTTDAAGSFQLRWSDERGVTISASKKGFETTFLQGLPDSQNVTLVLQRSAVIVGTVYSREGDPIQEAKVTAVREGNKWDKRQAITDSLGRFELAVGAGNYSLEAAADGYRPTQSKLLSLKTGERREGLVLELAAAVRGSEKPEGARR